MKILFIGGTGIISSACADLAVARGHELFFLNRAVSSQGGCCRRRYRFTGGRLHRRSAARGASGGSHFDAVVDYIAFHPNDIERDLRLFRGRTGQFVFISSASAYQKPVMNYLITEETPLENPYWEYSRNKIACEERLMQAHREEGFPVTIIRPSHTYGPAQLPFGVSSWRHPWTVVDRMKRGEKVIVPGMAPRSGC